MNRDDQRTPTLRRRTLGRALALAGAAVLCLGACGEDETGPCEAFDPPQILPDVNPICLSYDPTTVGTEVTRPSLIDNRGREDLRISNVSLITSDEFQLQTTLGGSAVSKDLVQCGADPAAVQILFRPTTAGWKTATVVIESNAQNFPNLEIFVLALAVPANDQTADPGVKPTNPDGSEPCPLLDGP